MNVFSGVVELVGLVRQSLLVDSRGSREVLLLGVVLGGLLGHLRLLGLLEIVRLGDLRLLKVLRLAWLMLQLNLLELGFFTQRVLFLASCEILGLLLGFGRTSGAGVRIPEAELLSEVEVSDILVLLLLLLLLLLLDLLVLSFLEKLMRFSLEVAFIGE